MIISSLIWCKIQFYGPFGKSNAMEKIFKNFLGQPEVCFTFPLIIFWIFSSCDFLYIHDNDCYSVRETICFPKFWTFFLHHWNWDTISPKTVSLLNSIFLVSKEEIINELFFEFWNFIPSNPFYFLYYYSNFNTFSPSL